MCRFACVNSVRDCLWSPVYRDTLYKHVYSYYCSNVCMTNTFSMFACFQMKPVLYHWIVSMTVEM